MLAPHVESLQKAHPGVTFYKFDTSNEALEGVARELGVSALPVFRFYKGGAEVIDQVIGYKKAPLAEAVQKLAAM